MSVTSYYRQGSLADDSLRDMNHWPYMYLLLQGREREREDREGLSLQEYVPYF